MTTTRCSRAKDEAMNWSGKFHLEANPWIFPKNVHHNMKFTNMGNLYKISTIGGGFEDFLFSPRKLGKIPNLTI